jgi:hypothetical protein
MDERVERVSALLHEAGETHHVVYRITDGADDDWASFYSDWLVNHSELPEILGSTPPRSAVTHLLVQAERDYAEQSPDVPWPDFYAEALVERLG